MVSFCVMILETIYIHLIHTSVYTSQFLKQKNSSTTEIKGPKKKQNKNKGKNQILESDFQLSIFVVHRETDALFSEGTAQEIIIDDEI